MRNHSPSGAKPKTGGAFTVLEIKKEKEKREGEEKERLSERA